jgi:hypothetical protein
MKKLLLTTLLAGITALAYGQGQVQLFNSDNASANPGSGATSGGLFFLDTGSGPALVGTDFNVVFTMGPASGPTTTVSFIGTQSGGPANGDNAFGPGTFFDLSGSSYPVPGVPNGTCTMTIQAWTGSSATYAGATFKGTATYSQRVSDSTISPPPTAPSLVDMPSIIMTGSVPEPSTFALAGLGAAALLIFRRRK